MRLTMGAASDVGNVRALNEDAFVAQGNLAVVADGMGGHACGEVASGIVRERMRVLGTPGLTSADDVLGGILSANAAIVDAAREDAAKAGMGTTITGIALIEHFENPHWLVFNVGDSRVYRIADGRAEQITQDHSEVAELVAAGQLTREQAAVHPLRNIVTRSLGVDPPPAIDTWLFPPQPGDTFVVCSDGLTNEVPEEEIARIAMASAPAEAALQLMNAALECGARDNVTVVVVKAASFNDAIEDTIPIARPH